MWKTAFNNLINKQLYVEKPKIVNLSFNEGGLLV